MSNILIYVVYFVCTDVVLLVFSFKQNKLITKK